MQYKRKYTPTFAVFQDRDDIPMNGVANLTASILISGSTVYPTFRYIGGMATATGWKPDGYGGADGNLVITGATNPVSCSQGSPCLGPDDDSVLFNNGQHYEEPGTTFGKVGTDDVIFETVLEMDTDNGVVSKITTGPLTGWALEGNGSTAMIVSFNDGVDATTVTSAALVPGQWYHVMAFLDRAGSGQIYVNGVKSGNATDISAVGAAIDVAAKFTVGKDVAFAGTEWTKRIAYLAMWQKASWLGTHLQADLAKDRFNQLTGIYPQVSKGSARPTTQTRATTAYIDKVEKNGERKLYQVGPGWLRCASRLDSNGSMIKGYLAEQATINKLPRSQTFATIWAGTWITAANAAGYAPDGTKTACSFTEGAEGVDKWHRINHQNIALTTGTNYVYSLFVKKPVGGRDWVMLRVIDIDGGSGLQIAQAYSLTGSTVGTGIIGVPVNAASEDFGNGWHRISFVFTTLATSNYVVYIEPANTDVATASTYTSSDTRNALWGWGAQLEIGNSPSSYVPTVASAVTRNADILTFKGDDGNVTNNRQGSMSADILNPGTAARKTINSTIPISLSDASDPSNDYIQLMTLPWSTNQAQCTSIAATVIVFDMPSTTSMWDGIKHNMFLTWKKNLASQYLDGTGPTPASDTMGTPPDDLDVISINSGAGYAVGQSDGIVANVKIWDKPNNTKG